MLKEELQTIYTVIIICGKETHQMYLFSELVIFVYKGWDCPMIGGLRYWTTLYTIRRPRRSPWVQYAVCADLNDRKMEKTFRWNNILMESQVPY